MFEYVISKIAKFMGGFIVFIICCENILVFIVINNDGFSLIGFGLS